MVEKYVPKLPPGLYKDDHYFYYQVSDKEYSWYECHKSNGLWRDCWGVAVVLLEPASPLEFVLLTGKAFDPTELEEAYGRGVARRAARKKSKKSKKRRIQEKRSEKMNRDKDNIKMNRGDKVRDKKTGKVYDFGYMGQTGLAICYEEGECNMQDAIGIPPDELDRL